jgi:spore germination protein
MVGKVSAEDSFYVKLLRDHYNIGKLELTINGDELPSSIMENLSDEIILVFDPIKTKKKVTLSSPSTPEFAINISMQARLIEIKPHIDVDKPDTSELLNKVIAKKLDDEINRVIGITQEVGSDVFGSGEIFRSTVRHSDLTKDTWPVLYENMTVTVRTDFTLLRNGVME